MTEPHIVPVLIRTPGISYRLACANGSDPGIDIFFTRPPFISRPNDHVPCYRFFPVLSPPTPPIVLWANAVQLARISIKWSTLPILLLRDVLTAVRPFSSLSGVSNSKEVELRYQIDELMRQVEVWDEFFTQPKPNNIERGPALPNFRNNLRRTDQVFSRFCSNSLSLCPCSTGIVKICQGLIYVLLRSLDLDWSNDTNPYPIESIASVFENAVFMVRSNAHATSPSIDGALIKTSSVDPVPGYALDSIFALRQANEWLSALMADRIYRALDRGLIEVWIDSLQTIEPRTGRLQKEEIDSLKTTPLHPEEKYLLEKKILEIGKHKLDSLLRTPLKQPVWNSLSDKSVTAIRQAIANTERRLGEALAQDLKSRSASSTIGILALRKLLDPDALRRHLRGTDFENAPRLPFPTQVTP